MIPGDDAWVFDTGPLRTFVLSGWLGVLKFLAGERPVFIPDVVQRELRRQAADDHAIGSVLDAEWVHVFTSSDTAYMASFARYAHRLVADGQNEGECGVLAMGATLGCEMVIDDSTPRGIAEEEGLRVTATVPILCDAIRAKQLTLPMVEHVADELLANEYYLPFGPGGFRRHVLEHGLLEYEETI
ncbi:nucleotide-binding protein [Nocardioides plantarum]|uniref:Nucleotide-binding protein n=1 Tax=Nocardioides plantarum TaxID=29299 RepID=A0ABV5KA27_9ACTN|nr:nucleotide-binding protein [Nocardioides plantarum]